MININKLKKIKSNFPVMIGKNALTKKDCKKLISEIQDTKKFDDLKLIAFAKRYEEMFNYSKIKPKFSN